MNLFDRFFRFPRLFAWAHRTHNKAESIMISRWAFFPLESNMEPIDFGTSKERNCSMKAFDIAYVIGSFLNKLFGYEHFYFISKYDSFIYGFTMLVYLAIRTILIIFTNGNFKNLNELM